jgi:tetratricopeptide (TPR) repeat protein
MRAPDAVSSVGRQPLPDGLQEGAMSQLRQLIAVLAAGAALLGADATAAADNTAAWAACQEQSAPATIDQLLEQCGASGCEATAPGIDLDQVVAGCSAIIDSPDEPPLRRALAAYQRGLARVVQGEQSDAIIDFNFAVSLEPGFAEAFERRGAAFASLGQIPNAISDLSRAIALKPSLAPAYSERALAYFRLHVSDQAIADESAAIRLRPDNAVDLNSRCWMRAVAGQDLQAALHDCDRAVELAPGVAGILDSRGFVRLRLRDFGGALADYRAALAANPKRPDVRASALYGGGLALIGLGDRTEGQADIAAALSVSPSAGRDYTSAGMRP